MRPFGTSEQLAERRQRALDLLRSGRSPSEVARRLGTTPQSVCRWQRESRQPKRTRPRNRRAPGRPSRLSKAQQQQLVSALNRGAYAQGYAENYWTLDRIAHLIWDRFQVRYGSSSVWYLMRRLGWSCQKPQRRSLSRDEAAVAHWKHYTWPAIKKTA